MDDWVIVDSHDDITFTKLDDETPTKSTDLQNSLELSTDLQNSQELSLNKVGITTSPLSSCSVSSSSDSSCRSIADFISSSMDSLDLYDDYLSGRTPPLHSQFNEAADKENSDTSSSTSDSTSSTSSSSTTLTSSSTSKSKKSSPPSQSTSTDCLAHTQQPKLWVPKAQKKKGKQTAAKKGRR